MSHLVSARPSWSWSPSSSSSSSSFPSSSAPSASLLSTRAGSDGKPIALPILPLPPGAVLLPGGVISIRIARRENVHLLQAVLTEAERAGNGHAGALLGLAPVAIPALAEPDSKAASPSSSSSSSPPSLQIIRLPDGLDRLPASGGNLDDQAEPPSVNELSEWACAARIVRIEKQASSFVVVRNANTGSGDPPSPSTSSGYTLVLEGLTRIRIDRWTSVGRPYFEAQVSLFPRSGEPVDPALAERLLEIANTVLDALGGPATPNGGSNGGSNGNGNSNSNGSSAPPRTSFPGLPSSSLASLSSLAVKRLRAHLRSFGPSTADEASDVLLSSLLPLSRPASYPAKLQHLSLTTPSARVEHAAAQLELLKSELDSREAVGKRYMSNMSRRTKEAVLRGLMEAIAQELRQLRRQQNQDDDDAAAGGASGSNGPVRIVGGPNGGRRAPGAPGGAEDDDAATDDEGEDDLATLARKVDESSMPPEARKIAARELRRLKSISPMSAEHGVITNYLDWMVSLPWERSSFDRASSSDRGRDGADGSTPPPGKSTVGQADFLGVARKQLDDDHFGISKVKERLLQFLAVIRLRNEAWEESEAKRAYAEREELEKQREADQKLADEKQSTPEAAGSSGSGGGGKKALPAPLARTPSPPGSPTEQERKPASPRSPRPQHRSPKTKAPILLLVGPPGVGKTSIAKSLATALGRPYTRIALGGVHDEAEIRGFKRTYVGSMPGTFVQALRRVGVNDPVILLDEIDKLSSGANLRGDPSAAMLEVLDPEQNHSFTDHYINTPIDLSSVTFVASANTLQTIPPPLLDRMEVISLSGYIDTEKREIARRFLLPKQIAANQMQPGHIDMDDDVLLHIIHRYAAYESGVRTLERQIGAVVRWKAVELIQARDKLQDKPPLDRIDIPGFNPKVSKDDLAEILGHNYHEEDTLDALQDVQPGVSTGLGYTGSGNGAILPVEVTSFPGNGQLRLTGSLGKVILESAQIALSWVKANAFELGLTSDKRDDVAKDLDIHVHLPEGAVPKDGPSAGVALVLAMISLFSALPLDPSLAVTGEISLRGKVMPVGGIKEKVMAAHRAGIKTVILPLRNQKDATADLPTRIRDSIQITYAESIWQALEVAFGDRLYQHLPQAAAQVVRRRQPRAVSHI